MLEGCQSAQERWGGVNRLIDRWLQERHTLIGAYAALSELAPERVDAEAQHRFCEILLDYVSAGHFEIYQQLMDEAESVGDQRGMELARQLYPRIDATTEAALRFNDRCDGSENKDCRDAEFKRLGQLLHERFELEDCLIEVLHKAHEKRPLEKPAEPV